MARSFTDKQIYAALKKALGASSKKYNVDETYTTYELGVGPRAKAPTPIADRHEAGVIERLLEIADIPARMHAASRGGYWITIPKITS